MGPPISGLLENAAATWIAPTLPRENFRVA